MGVFKRSTSKYWYYEFQFEGERYRGSTKQTNKRAALEFERQTLEDLKGRKLKGYTGVMTLGAVVDLYEAKHLPTTRSAKAINPQIKAVRELLPLDKPIHEVTQDDVMGMFNTLIDRGMAEYTASLYVTRLRAIIGWMGEHNQRIAMPVIGKWPKGKRRKRERVLSVSEEHRLLEVLDPDRAAPGMNPVMRRNMVDAYDVAIMLIDTGARISEAVSATWSSIDWANETIELYRIKTDSLSTVPLSPRLIEVLERRREFTEGSAYVFPSVSNNPRATLPHMSTDSQQLGMAFDRAGLNEPHMVQRYGRATVHTLRHTFITRLAEKGIDPWTLKDVAGHGNLQTTLGYVHKSNQNLAGVRSALTGSPQSVRTGGNSPHMSTHPHNRVSHG